MFQYHVFELMSFEVDFANQLQYNCDKENSE